eukprot:m51a1_g6897 hypothetical protein (183) ;mRNA; f:21089-21701
MQTTQCGSAEPCSDWRRLGPEELADHIEQTHHARAWSELPRLGALVDEVARAHGARHPELGRVREAYHKMRANLESHLRKEERVLFPVIRSLAGSKPYPFPQRLSVSGPVAVMRSEHEAVGRLFSEMREATGGFATPEDGDEAYRELMQGIAALEADTHVHAGKEDDVLFPRAVELDAHAVA